MKRTGEEQECKLNQTSTFGGAQVKMNATISGEGKQCAAGKELGKGKGSQARELANPHRGEPRYGLNMEARKDSILMCVSLAVSHGFPELTLNSPRILKSCQRQKRCVTPMRPALNQCLQRIGFKILTLRARAEMPSPTLLGCGRQFTLSQEAAGPSIILLQFHEQSGGVKAPAWLKVERNSSCDAVTWHACSGTTPGS